MKPQATEESAAHLAVVLRSEENASEILRLLIEAGANILKPRVTGPFFSPTEGAVRIKLKLTRPYTDYSSTHPPLRPEFPLVLITLLLIGSLRHPCSTIGIGFIFDFYLPRMLF